MGVTPQRQVKEKHRKTSKVVTVATKILQVQVPTNLGCRHNGKATNLGSMKNS